MTSRCRSFDAILGGADRKAERANKKKGRGRTPALCQPRFNPLPRYAPLSALSMIVESAAS